jgi:hypothetical protein
MRLSIYDQFIVGVVRPDGGWSKGRPIAYIEDDEKCVPLFDLLIPNDLDDEELARYVSGKFSAFAQPSKRIDALGGDPTRELHKHNQRDQSRGVAQLDTVGGVQR